MELSAFLLAQFPSSSFCGRVQIGCRGRGRSAVLPALTCDYSALASELSTFVFSPRADYYIMANAVSGVQRISSGLFSLHNLVIDLDCHEEGLDGVDRDYLIDSLLWRCWRDVFEVLLPSPTSVVRTGRGVQLWWSIEGISSKFKTFYDEVLDDFIGELSGILVDSILDDFSMFSVDVVASKNGVGFFRLPTTMNTKVNEKVCFEVVGKTYDLMELFEGMKCRKKMDAVYSKDEPSGFADGVAIGTVISCQNVASPVRFAGKDWVDMAHGRVSALESLRLLRGRSLGEEERNNFCFMVYNSFVPCYGHDIALAKTKEFNAHFRQPMTDRELSTVISSAKRKGGYQYTNEKMMEFLGISQEESLQIGISPCKHLNKREQKKAKNYTKKQKRDDEIVSLYAEGKTMEEVATALSISAPTVSKVLKERGLLRGNRQKFENLAKNGYSLGEIAVICGCSERTVRRKLV